MKVKKLKVLYSFL